MALPQNSETLSTAEGARRSGDGDTSRLAHDARNWLTVLRIYCDLLRTSGAIASGYEPWMDELSGAVERGQGLVDSLLDSVVAEKREVPFRDRAGVDGHAGGNAEIPSAGPVSSVDLASALSRRLPVLRRMAGSNIQVELSTPPHAETVLFTESDFERILYNLVVNAIEAMPRGGKLHIALDTSPERIAASGAVPEGPSGASGATVVLRVTDTGSGIGPDRLPGIFTAGVSGKRERAAHPERHGFGLAIVRELTERAGGSVRAESQPGSGSRFEVSLPAM